MKTTELPPIAHEHASQGDQTTKTARIKPQRLKLKIVVHWAQYTVVARPEKGVRPSNVIFWVFQSETDAFWLGRFDNVR